MLVIKIQSASDIITNSSSEIFQLKSDLSLDVVRQMIMDEGQKNIEARPERWYDDSKYGNTEYDGSSGMGCHLEIYGWEEVYENAKEWDCAASKKDLYTPEVWALKYDAPLEELKQQIWVDIDWARKATIDFILRTFWVVNVDSWRYYAQINPDTKEIIRIVTEDMYEQLPENERYQHED